MDAQWVRAGRVAAIEILGRWRAEAEKAGHKINRIDLLDELQKILADGTWPVGWIELNKNLR